MYFLRTWTSSYIVTVQLSHQEMYLLSNPQSYSNFVRFSINTLLAVFNPASRSHMAINHHVSLLLLSFLVWTGFSIFICLDPDSFEEHRPVILFLNLGSFGASSCLDSGCALLAAVPQTVVCVLQTSSREARDVRLSRDQWC